MADVREEQEKKERATKSPRSHAAGINSRKPSTKQKDSQPQPQKPSPLWFYLTILIPLVTPFFFSLSYLSGSQDPKSWFISLPPGLRQHYSSGRVIKVQISRNQFPVEVFMLEAGQSGSENVVFLHGLGLSSFAFRDTIRYLSSKGIHVVALDLPGNGFSDKSMIVMGEERIPGPFEKLKEAYTLIKEKGIFWAFDQMVETGQVPYEEIMKLYASKRESVRAIELGSEEMGRVLDQVVDAVNLPPVHLVLHDSALVMASNWVFENARSIQSITLIDTGSKPALPTWIFDVPVIRELVLGFPFAFSRLITFCCTNGESIEEMNAQRILLKARNGGSAVAGSLKKWNSSFDLTEWGSLDATNLIPKQVIWANEWSSEWREEGKRVSNALPNAQFIEHSGGRWPQKNVAGEIAEHVAQFISSLPKTRRSVKEEPVPEHIQQLLDEAKALGDDHHGHAHGSHDHHHHGAGYAEGYGLGHGWAG